MYCTQQQSQSTSIWRTLHYMKHYSTYVVYTTTKPKYIHVAHTTLHEALQYICSAHNNKAKVHPGTAHRHKQAWLRNGTPAFRPSPGRPRSAPGRDPGPPTCRDRSTQRPRPLAHRERGTAPGDVLPFPQNKLFYGKSEAPRERGKRGSEKGRWGNPGDSPRFVFQLQHPPTHARDDEAFSEGSEVHFVLMLFREHICGIADTRMVLQVNLFV
jgi:hypothetical protein